MHKQKNGIKIVRLLVICFLSLISVACGSSSSYLSTFIEEGYHYDGGKWSPDGRWFAANAWDESSALHLFAPDGTLKQSIYSACHLVSRDFAWMPDGGISCIAIQEVPLSNLPPGPKKIILFELDQKGLPQKSTEVVEPFTPGDLVYDFEWNPHHFLLASIADIQPGGHTSPTLYLTDLQGQNLIDPLPVDAEGLAWSPDGTTLALVRRDGDIDLLKIEENGSTHLTVAQTSRLKPKPKHTQHNVAWSPSGHWLVCRHGTPEGEDYLCWVCLVGGGKRVKLTSSTTDGQLAYPAWSPDGKRLIVQQVVLAGGSLLSLDIARFLKDQGLQP